MNYSYTRYWYHQEDEVRFDAKGYLIDPRDRTYLNRQCSLSETKDVYDHYCSILLADSGFGKSTELKRITELAGQENLKVKFYDLEAWAEYKKLKDELGKLSEEDGTQLIVVDSLEAVVNRGDAIEELVAEICNIKNRGSFRFVIACRQNKWLQGIETHFEAMLDDGDADVYFLAPLTEGNVRDAITSQFEEAKAEKLLSVISDQRLDSLACIPIMLQLLMKSVGSDQVTAFDRCGIYNKALLRIVQEFNTARKTLRNDMDSDRGLKVASWIAFITIFSDKGVINKSDTLVSSKYAVDIEDELVTDKIRESEIMEVLQSNLFVQLDENNYRWSHRSYSEFLCAKYLTDKLTDEQMDDLIFHPVAREKVIPKLFEVVSWMLQMKQNEQLITLIIENDYPLIFLSDLEKYSEKVKRTFLLAILKALSREEHHRTLSFMNKAIYRTCRFAGVHDWIQHKINLYEKLDNRVSSSERDRILDAFYEGAQPEGKPGLYEEVLTELIEMGFQCGYQEMETYSLKIAATYYNIGRNVFEIYLRSSPKEKVHEVFNKMKQGTLQAELKIKQLRGAFVLDIVWAMMDEKSAQELIEFLGLFKSEIAEDQRNLSELKRINNYLGIELVPEGNSPEPAASIKESHAQRPSETPAIQLMKRRLSVHPANNTNNNIEELCLEVISGNYSQWEKAAEALIFHSYGSLTLYRLLENPRQPKEILTSINWHKISNKELIIEAANVYFNNYIYPGDEPASWSISTEHRFLLSILIEESPSTLLQADEERWNNWIQDIIQFPSVAEILMPSAYAAVPQKIMQIATAGLDHSSSGWGIVKSNLEILLPVWDASIAKHIFEYMTAGSIHLKKRKEILYFLLDQNDAAAVRLAEVLVSGMSDEDVGFKMYVLNYLFVNGKPAVFDTLAHYMVLHKDSMVQFIFLLKEENHYFDFLAHYSSVQLAQIYSWMKSNEEYCVQAFNRKKGYKDNEYSFEIKAILESLLYGMMQDTSGWRAYESLYHLTQAFPADELVSTEWNRKAEKYLNESWQGLASKSLKLMAENKDYSLLDSSDKLMSEIIKALEHLQSRLNGENSIKRLLWDQRPDNKDEKRVAQPKNESVISDYIRWELESYFRSNKARFSREVEISPQLPSEGRQIIDINCIGFDDREGIDQVYQVYIEVKGCWNPLIKKSAEEQLQKKYMTKNPYGIYVIGAFYCETWTNFVADYEDKRYYSTEKKKNLNEIRAFYSNQAAEINSRYGGRLEAFVMDFTI